MRVDQTRIPGDVAQIILAIKSDVRYRCVPFDGDADELRAAVSTVGTPAEAVEQRLEEALRKAFKNTGED